MPRFKCPHCRSADIQRFSVAYTSGISQVHTNTTGIGISLSGKVGVGGAKTRGQSQTELSRMTAPPAQLKYGARIGLCFALLVVLSLMKVPDAIALPCGVGLAAFLIVKAYRYNRDVYPQLLREWESSWICLRCGHRFVMT